MRIGPIGALLASFSVLTFVSPFAHAQTEKGISYAFLVSCKGYEKLEKLPFTVKEMGEFKEVLLQSGYEADHILDLNDDLPGRQLLRYAPEKNKILKELKLLVKSLRKQDTILVVLNGHGLHFSKDKISYFCPIDADPHDKSTLVPLEGEEGLFTILEKADAQQKLLLVNACRNEPGDIRRADMAQAQIDVDLDGFMDAPKGAVAVYSCKAGQKSYFDSKRERSYFFDHLIRGWKREYHKDDEELGLEALIDTITPKISSEVRNNPAIASLQVPQIKRGVGYEGRWLIPRIGKELVPGTERVFDVGNGVKMTFCWIPPSRGKVTLGSPKKEQDYVTKSFYERKRPDWMDHENQYVIEGLDGFWMAKTEMTQGQYLKITGKKNPSSFCKEGDRKDKVPANTDDFPVDSVSWNDAQECIKEMKVPQGMKKISLPSEAQWEYAYRGGKGNGRPFYWGDELNGDSANCDGNYPFGDGVMKGEYLQRTTKAGSYELKARHPWGLVDMSGNVYEWCEDYYGPYEKLPKGKNPVQTQQQSNGRVLRGGSWFLSPLYCRAASRNFYSPDVRYNLNGFRVVVLP